MKILLPHREVNLDINPKTIPPIEERKLIVENLLQEKIIFHSETMTVEEYLINTWSKSSSKAIMDLIGYYLSKDSKTTEEQNDSDYYGKPIKEDRYIMSQYQENEAKKSSKRYTTFSSMGRENQQNLDIFGSGDY